MAEFGPDWRLLGFAFFAKSSANFSRCSKLNGLTVAPKWSRVAKSLIVSGQLMGLDKSFPGKGRDWPIVRFFLGSTAGTAGRGNPNSSGS